MPLLAQSHLSHPDYFMLVGYFVLMLGIGVYFYRYMRGMKMYFSGGNKIPWWLAGVSFFMSSFSAYAFVIYSGLCFKFGFVGVTLYWVTVPATIFSVTFFASLWRRARIDSPVEFLETRYGALLRQLFVWEGLPVGLIDDSFKLVATGTIVHVGMGLPLVHSIIGCALIMLAYTFMGGIWAVTVTDFVQFVILTVAVLIIFPLSIAKVGGFHGLVAHSPGGFFHLLTDEYNWLYWLLLAGLYCVSWSSTNWPLIQKYYCVANEREARKAGWLVVLLNIIAPPMMFGPAIAAYQFLKPGTLDTEVYPQLCVALLPVGMLGLVIAAMFSATMGNLSSHFNVRASVLTNDVYRRLLRPQASQRELVVAGRAMTLLIGLITLGVALLLAKSTAKELFKYMVTLFSCAAAPLGIPMLLGLTSKRVNNLSGIAGLLGGTAIGVVLLLTLPGQGVIYGTGIHWEQETVLFAATAVATLLIMYSVSILVPMKAEERARVEAFHRELNSPIGQLPQDIPKAEHAEQTMSPFGVVGVCMVCIGLMMVAIQPWVQGGLPRLLNVLLGLGLVVLGVLMAWLSARARAAARVLASESATSE